MRAKVWRSFRFVERWSFDGLLEYCLCIMIMMFLEMNSSETRIGRFVLRFIFNVLCKVEYEAIYFFAIYFVYNIFFFNLQIFMQ